MCEMLKLKIYLKNHNYNIFIILIKNINIQ